MLERGMMFYWGPHQKLVYLIVDHVHVVNQLLYVLVNEVITFHHISAPNGPLWFDNLIFMALFCNNIFTVCKLLDAVIK